MKFKSNSNQSYHSEIFNLKKKTKRFTQKTVCNKNVYNKLLKVFKVFKVLKYLVAFQIKTNENHFNTVKNFKRG